jgi:pimeloyl-ACP methyl ester carboxylesterase
MIKRRLVYQIAGYDPVGADGHYRRFVRGIPTFARTWNVTAAVSELTKPPDGAAARWTVTTQAPNWRVEATFQPLPWDDIVRADFAKPTLQRLGRFALAVFDFFRTATVVRYFQASFRYGFFFLFPLVYLIAFATVGYFIGRWIAGYWQLQGVAYGLTVAAVGIATFFGLLQWPGRRWRVLQALDDWICSWDYLHGRRPDIEARLGRFAEQLVEAARGSEFDEIVVVGHSLGATLAINIVARAIERDPALGTRGVPVCVLTVGSTIPKFTLHPGAERIRRDIDRVATAGAVEWAEYHARADPISFYKFDPATGRTVGDRFDRKPIIRMVRIRSMLEKPTYRRIRHRFMRVHHQFVMANERRTAYDFYMMGCGPIPFRRAVVAMEGPAELIGADGGLLETAQAR